MIRSLAPILSATVLLAGTFPLAAQDSLPRVPALNRAAVTAVVEAAEAEARMNGWNVVIAVMDASGTLAHLSRMDGVQPGSVQVAQDKARSAALFRRPTQVFGDAVAGGAIGLLTLSGSNAVEGGEPLVVDGQVVGAIGVSGVTPPQDGQIARAGAEALATQFRD